MDGISLCQRKYAAYLVNKFGMLNCNPVKTPLSVNDLLSFKDGAEKTDEKYSRSLVGGLMYLTHTRPDLMFAVSFISRHMHNPNKHHLGATK